MFKLTDTELVADTDIDVEYNDILKTEKLIFLYNISTIKCINLFKQAVIHIHAVTHCTTSYALSWARILSCPFKLRKTGSPEINPPD